MSTKLTCKISKISGSKITLIHKVQFQEERVVTLPVKYEKTIDKAVSLIAEVVKVEIENGQIIGIEKA